MTITYASTKVLSPAVHKRHYLLELDHGKIIAVCRGCGKWLSYEEVLRRINSEASR